MTTNGNGTRIFLASEENSKIIPAHLFALAALNQARKDADAGDWRALRWLETIGALLAERLAADVGGEIVARYCAYIKEGYLL